MITVRAAFGKFGGKVGAKTEGVDQMSDPPPAQQQQTLGGHSKSDPDC